MQNTNFQVWSPRPTELIMVEGDRLVTDSLVMGEVFKKPHRTILRAYDNLKCSDNFNRHNFVPIEYVDNRGRPQRHIKMTKDGFTMLAMGFTGEKATQFKEAYIEAFNAMADYIAAGEKNLWQKMQALIAKETSSQVRASFGSHLMLGRKKEIPPLREERKELEAVIQPSLLN